MGSTRMTRRTAARHNRRPDMEALEIRTLLSTSQGIGQTQIPITLGPPKPADGGYSAGDTYYDQFIGATAARAQYGVDGTGETVAVIDGGVNYNHEALGGGFGAGYKVIGGYDFADNDGDPFAKTLDHGTAVAGLIASSDPAHLGVSPGADVVALRVFDDNNNGDFTRVADALQWVIDNHDQYRITAVNLSLSDGQNYTQNWFAHDGGVGQRITTLIGNLDTLNIPVMTAAGNSFNGTTQGEGFTAIVPDTISVTSSDANDALVSNAQRLGVALGGDSATDLAAPGDGLEAPLSGNSFGGVGGTSFATPLVTGAVLLMQQVYQQRFHTLPTVAQLDGWLQGGSDPIKDAATGITIGRLDIPKAIGLIPNPVGQILTPPTDPTPVTPPAQAPVVTAPPAAPPVVTTPPVDLTPTGPVPQTPPADTTPAPAPDPTPTPTPPVQTTAPVETPAPVVAPVDPTPSTPADVATPVAASPPAATTTTATTTDTGFTLWVAGKSVTSAELANPTSSKLASLPAWFLSALQSFKSWWTSPVTNAGANGQIWSAKLLNAAQPAGTVKVKTSAGSHAHTTTTKGATSHARSRFVASQRGR